MKSMKEIVQSIYQTTSDDSFFAFAFQLRILDPKNDYTSQILAVNAIPKIITDIICSNSWNSKSGKMIVVDKFAVKLQLAQMHILQYEVHQGNKSKQVFPIVQEEIKTGYSDKFVFVLTPSGFALETKKGQLTLAETTQLQ